MKPIKPKPGNKYQESVGKTKLKYALDRIDYQRTIAGRGDTHALDGGEVAKKQMPKKKQMFKKKQRLITKTPAIPTPAIPTWEDRNRAIQGTKLSK